MVPFAEIRDAKNDYNLNIPRYIDSQEIEDIQNIEAHLCGGIPGQDIDALDNYWKVYPTLKTTLLKPKKANFWDLNCSKDEIKSFIFEHSEFIAFSNKMDNLFSKWQKKTVLTI